MTRALPNQSVAKGVEYERVPKGCAQSEDAQRWQGWGTALKPAWEPMVLARKPLDGTVAENVLKHGTGAINVDGCRVEGESTKRSNHGGTGDPTQWRTGNGADFESGSDKGRFPANIVHDGSEEVEAAFPQTVSGAMKQEIGAYEGDNVTTFLRGVSGPQNQHGDSGSAARFFYSAKADAEDRVGSRHPTVKPIDLMAWLVRLITPPGGTVLDPFAGTGTTGIAALREGFNAILIEREAEYLGDIAARIALATDPDAGHSLSVKGRHKDKATAAGKGTPLFGDA